MGGERKTGMERERGVCEREECVRERGVCEREGKRSRREQQEREREMRGENEME